jgi:phage-related protein
MPLPLAARIEKNKTSTTSAMLWLLEVQLTIPIYLVNNNENITWNGREWLAFPFTIGNVTDDGKESISAQIKISNITRSLGVVVSAAKGAGGTQVILRAVNSALLSDVTAIYIEETFQITKTQVDAYWITFTIGIPKDLVKRFPARTVLKDFCPYRFKDIECAYNGAATECNKTLARCRELNNSRRFGGEPGLVGNLG